jgi:hypothetical protein
VTVVGWLQEQTTTSISIPMLVGFNQVEPKFPLKVYVTIFIFCRFLGREKKIKIIWCDE